jgi:hypothetical protein
MGENLSFTEESVTFSSVHASVSGRDQIEKPTIRPYQSQQTLANIQAESELRRGDLDGSTHRSKPANVTGNLNIKPDS